MIRTDPEFEAWVETARSVSVERAAGLVGFAPAKGQRGVERSGPCPVCGGTDRFSINLKRNYWNCRGCGRGGRDGIGLVMHGLGLADDFLAACEVVEGPRPNPPAGETEDDRAERRRRQQARLDEIRRAREAADATRESEENAYREKERAKAFGWWRQGFPLFATPAEVYLRARGLDLPPGMRLRWHPSWTLYDGETDDGARRVVHRGPAIFAPIVGPIGGVADRFMGLHVTWFDPARPGEKVRVPGEDGSLVPAKKIRGVKKGGHIVLVQPPGPMTRLVTGEGIETVLTPWTAFARRGSPLLDGCGFWTSVDLGNLGGKAVDRLRHPSETKADTRGRARPVRVPGIVPDLESAAMAIPDGVSEVFYCGDGDSEPFRTRCTIARAVARNARPGLTQRVVMAPSGADFNDIIRGRAHV